MIDEKKIKASLKEFIGEENLLWLRNEFTKLRRERCEVFSLAYESPRIINISKNYTQKIQKS